MAEPVTVTYVQMLTPPRGRAGHADTPEPGAVSVRRAERPNPALNRWLYLTVGADYQWVDRARWSDDDWADVVTAAHHQTWLGYCDGSPIGYFELDVGHEPNVEIVYFGLLPTFVGQGLGGRFLDAAIDSAWGVTGTERVWLHTCTDDHPRALPNYLAAGFETYDVRQEYSH